MEIEVVVLRLQTNIKIDTLWDLSQVTEGGKIAGVLTRIFTSPPLRSRWTGEWPMLFLCLRKEVEIN